MPRSWAALLLVVLGVTSAMGACLRAAFEAPKLSVDDERLGHCAAWDGGAVRFVEAGVELVVKRDSAVDALAPAQVRFADGGALCLTEVSGFHDLVPTDAGLFAVAQWDIEGPGIDLHVLNLTTEAVQRVPTPCDDFSVSSVRPGRLGVQIDGFVSGTCFLRRDWWTWGQRAASRVVGEPVAELGAYRIERRADGRWQFTPQLP